MVWYEQTSWKTMFLKIACKKLMEGWNTTTVLIIFKDGSHGSHKVLDKFDDSQMHDGVSPDLSYLKSEKHAIGF